MQEKFQKSLDASKQIPVRLILPRVCQKLEANCEFSGVVELCKITMESKVYKGRKKRKAIETYTN